ncbi:MAG TPA: hypothetical protein VE954_00680 [Oligoflexus sp.]|uniref:hypothetical protein n=1 Tax=Oligoflexus sp. TaxID=1971216 RepID=UPI002D5112F2|nr:hypothetical protein [Oligoflexus sp.]HYX31594.1 hypothetical protein [Oligoflexus sp.]
MNRLINFLLPVMMSAPALGATLSVIDGQEITVPVSPDGVTIQLPTFVKIVTPAKGHYVEPLATPATAPVEGQAQTQSDVRAFVIKPAKSGVAEKITFILADDRTVTVHLSPGNTADSFYDIKWAPRGSSSTNIAKKDSGFLTAERSLLLSMLRDEDTGSRKIVDMSLKLDRYPDLKIKLVRTYQLHGLTGYVFTLTNATGKTMVVNPTVLTIGVPNRAILTQLDHETLEPCSRNNSSDPRGTGCLTALRMVVNGSGSSSVKLGSNERLGMPYTLDAHSNFQGGGTQ